MKITIRIDGAAEQELLTRSAASNSSPTACASALLNAALSSSPAGPEPTPIPAEPAPLTPTVPAAPTPTPAVAPAPTPARPAKLVLAISLVAVIALAGLILAITNPAPAPASGVKTERVEALEARIATLEKDRERLIEEIKEVTAEQFTRIEGVEKKLKTDPVKPQPTK